MRKQKKNDNVILNLALSLALATTPLSTSLFASSPVLAESQSDTPGFLLPETVESGTKVRIDGSVNLLIINQSLKDNFEKLFSGTQVEINNNGADSAIKDLLDGKIDIAAIGRGITPEEKAQGLEQIRLRKEKIAIIVGANNHFQGDLTSKQFAQIFRGEITDWSEIGGKSGKIRFIDHPENSDTRNSFRGYPVFQSQDFSTGKNAILVEDNQIDKIVTELGQEGISYALNNQVSKLADVRVLTVEGFTPDDSEYPFSQPLVYVYKKDPSPAVASFLGYTLAPVGKKAIIAAREAEASMIAARTLQNITTTSGTNSASETKSSLTAVESETATNTVNPRNDRLLINPVDNNQFEDRNLIFLIALSSVPIIGFASFLSWWLKKKQSSINQNIDSQETSLTYINSTTESTAETPEENIIIDPFASSTNTNDDSDFHNNNNANATIINTDENLIYITKETSSENTNGTTHTHNISQQNLEKVDFSDSAIALDCGEVVWDTEAPVAVVNAAYSSVSNIPKIPVNDLEIRADYDIDKSLSDLLNEETDISPENKNNLSETLNGYNLSSQELNTSLANLDLLNEDIDVSSQEATNALLEILNEKSDLPTQESNTSLADLLDEKYDVLDQKSTNLLLEKVGLLVAKNDLDPNISLSELLDTISQSGDINTESSSEILKSLNLSTDQSNSVSISSLADLLGVSSPTEEAKELDPKLMTDEAKQLISELSDELSQVFNTLVDEVDEVDEIDEIDEIELNADLARELSLNLPVASNHFPNSIVNEEIVSDINSDNISLDLNNQSQTTELTVADINGNSSIVFTPRTPKWAYVSWYFSENQKTIAKNQGGYVLLVRLYDVTDLDLSYQIPQLVQQYECEEVICDCYIAIPTSNRDYLAEIGYLTQNNTWLCMARSSKVRIFSRPSGDFWFVADTELVIHGSTEPGATVTIGGNKIKLQSDGTFHLRVPFSDNLLKYMMTASAADGESSITILKKFFQENADN